MRLRMSCVASGALLAGALALAACTDSTSSNACGSGTAPVVVGTYKLASYTLGASTIDTAQGASGQLRFYTSTYGFNLTIPIQGAISDSGTYAISGARCMSEVSVQNPGTTTGTFSLSGTTPGSIFTFAGTNSAIGALGFSAVRQ